MLRCARLSMKIYAKKENNLFLLFEPHGCRKCRAKRKRAQFHFQKGLESQRTRD